MKCQDIDYIACLEGRASGEMESHLAACPACREGLREFSLFMNRVLPVYREGKRREKEIERGLAEMDLDKLEPLPPGIAKRVKALRERRIVFRLKKVLDDKAEDTRMWIDSIMNPQMSPLPAIPKDIAKTGKSAPGAQTKLKRSKSATAVRKPPKKDSAGNVSE